MTSIRARAVSPTMRVAAIFRAAVSTAVAMAAVAAVMVPRAASAQETTELVQPDSERFPPNTLVVRYQIDPALFESVTNTAELVALLREHLMVEAGMPLDETLYVSLAADVHGHPSGFYNLRSPRLGFLLGAGTDVSSDLASVVRASHEAESFSDWDEEEAWAWLLKGLDDALAEPSSLVVLANGPRERDDAGHVILRIVAVHFVRAYQDEAWELAESLERDYIELAPRPKFASSSMAGWEPPEGFSSDVQMLYLELEPVVEVELTAIELSAGELDRFVGNYEIRPGAILEIWREGNALMAAPRDDKTRVATLNPYAQTEFWADVGGRRQTFAFDIDSDGAVESVTMEQTGFSMTAPRVP